MINDVDKSAAVMVATESAVADDDLFSDVTTASMSMTQWHWLMHVANERSTQ